MASIIPNRPPEDLGLRFYATGSYGKTVNFDKYIAPSAFHLERNRHLAEEIDIKPITQTSSKHLSERPQYLKGYERPPLPQLKRATMPPSRADLSLNSLHATTIFNRKTMINENQAKITASPAKFLPKDEYNFMKKQLESLDTVPSTQQSLERISGFRSSGHMSISKLPSAADTPKSMHGRVISEAHNYISQNQNEFFANHKIRFKPNIPAATALSNDIAERTEQSPVIVNRNKFYQYSTPDYLRVSKGSIERPSPQGMSISSKAENQAPALPVTVISRTNGWLTVDPETLIYTRSIQFTISYKYRLLNRKFAIEKDTNINIRETSKLAPTWMITDKQADWKQYRKFKPQPVNGQIARVEKKRLMLGETEQVYIPMY